MHFMKLIDSKCLGALNFTDENMQPKARVLTIKAVRPGRPPAAGKSTKEKGCVYFEETDKGAFLSNGQMKRLANMLMAADTDMWVGAKVTISCAETTYGGQKVMGMVVLKAERARRDAAQQAAPQTQARTDEPLPEDNGREP